MNGCQDWHLVEIARLWGQSDPDWFFEQPPEVQQRLLHWYEPYLTGDPFKPQE